MVKKDVSTIMKKGTAKQRIMLLASHIAEQQLNKEGFLTEKEVNSLSDSFKTSSETRLYNKFRETDRIVRHGLPYLSQLLSIYLERIAYLNGYSIMYFNALRQCDTLNYIVSETKSKAQKEKTKEIITKETEQPLLYKYKINKRGDISLNLDVKIGLKELFAAHKKQAIEQLRNGKTFIKAILEFMEDKEFNVEPYIKKIEEIEDIFKEDRAPVPYMSKKQLRDKLGEEGAKSLIKEGETESFLFPDYSETEIDEELYKYFREDYFE